ncbi:hypothetical protein D9M69_458410 [compost metagenome]
MAFQPGVVDALDTGLLLQPARDFQGAGAVGLHAHTQRFQTLDHHPGVEGAESRARGTQETHDFLHVLGTAGDHAAHGAALAVDVLGGRMHDDVGPQFQRLLQGRGAEAVVHHQQGALLVGDVGQGRNVDQLCQGVGRRLDEQQFGIGLDCRLPAVQIGQGRVVDFDAEALEVLLEQTDGGAEYAAGHQHVVATTAQAHGDGEDGGHAGRGGHGLLGPFQCGDALFEGSHSRVGVTRIDVARHFAGKARCGVGSGAEHVAGGEEHGLAVLTLRRATLSGTHSQGFEGRAFQVTVQPSGFPFLRHVPTSSKT